MILKKFLSMFLFWPLISMAQIEQPKTHIYANSFDTSLIAVLAIGDNADWFKSNQSYQITKEEFITIDSLLRACIAISNSVQKNTRQRWNYCIYLDYYKRQYIPFFSNGERKVFVNCFNDSLRTDWHTQMINVDGGGRNFFKLFVNLTNKNYYDFSINPPL